MNLEPSVNRDVLSFPKQELKHLWHLYDILMNFKEIPYLFPILFKFLK